MKLMSGVYVFDLDGTLMNSMGYFAEGMVSILREDGVDYPPDILNIITPMGTVKAAEYFKSLGAHGSTEQIIERMGKNMIAVYKRLVKAKPFVTEYLQKLKGEGARLYVLTASPHITVDPCLKNNGIYSLFDEVWSTDDFGGLTKSAGTELFYAVAERVGCKAEDINYFDDNIIALKNAGLAGLQTVGVYDEYYEVPMQEVKASSKKYIMSFEEVLN